MCDNEWLSNGYTDTTANELKADSVQTIGSLGYILLDEQSYTLTTSFVNSVFNLDKNSTDNFAMYRFIFMGEFVSNASQPQIQLEFRDLSGQISAATSMIRDIYNFNGSSVFSGQSNNITIGHYNVNTSNTFRYNGFLDMTLTNTNEITTTGQSFSHTKDNTATEKLSLNINGSLYSNTTISTRITGFGVRYQNGTSGSIKGRVFRMI